MKTETSLKLRGKVEISDGDTILVSTNQITINGALRLLESVSTSLTGKNRINAITLLSGLTTPEADLENVTLQELLTQGVIQEDSTVTIYATASNDNYAFDGTTLEVNATLPPSSLSLNAYNAAVLMSGKTNLGSSSYVGDLNAQPFAIVYLPQQIVRSTFKPLLIKWRITIDVS